MPGNVTGSIGNEEVNINNAATESTLAALFRIAEIDSKNLLALAKKAGVDSANLKDFDEELKQSAIAQQTNTASLIEDTKAKEAEAQKYKTRLSILTQLDASMTKLMDGTMQASDVFGAFKDAGPLIGTLAAGFERLASIQQKNFETYQKLTDVGVGFSGSLTDMRIAAAQSYLTLDEFQNVIKNNSKLLGMLGGTADEGARNFSKLSNTLVKSDAGTHLMSLGYTTAQLNEGLGSYLTMTGGRTSKELKNTNDIAAASAQYMEQLDGLARVTGESREEQQKALKEQQANAAWQAKLAGMSEKEKAKAVAGLANALAVGGKGAADAFQSKVMGIPPLTKEAQMFTATMGKANNSIMQSASNVNDGTKTMADMNESFFQSANDVQADISKYDERTKAALIAQGGPLGQSIQPAQEHANKFGKQTDEQRRAAMATQKIEATQAADMANAMKGLKELGASLWTAFSPIISVMTSVLGALGKFAGFLAKMLDGGGNVTKVLAAMALAGGLFLAWQAKNFAVEQAKRAGGLLMGGGGGGLVGGAPGPAESLAGKAGGGMLGGIGSALKGAASGLRAFANPQVMLGAAGFGVAIAAIGAGIAAASWLMGKALPTLAEGLGKIAELDGGKLGAAAMGIGKIGLSLLAFGPFALFGLPAGLALNMLADGIVKLNSVDPIKLERVAAAMQKVKDATPSIGQSIAAGVSGLVSKVTGVTETPAAEGKTAAAAPASGGNNIEAELKLLNKQTAEMIKYIKEGADHAKQNVSATKSLNGDLFKF